MSELQIREFENPGFDLQLGNLLDSLEVYSHLLQPDQINRLRSIIGDHAAEKVVYGPEFDIADEISQQITAVRALRESVLPGGVVRAGLPAREIKDAISASSTLITNLMKHHDKILGFERSRAVELAVSETIKTLSDEDRATFMKKLEENLSAIE